MLGTWPDQGAWGSRKAWGGATASSFAAPETAVLECHCPPGLNTSQNSATEVDGLPDMAAVCMQRNPFLYVAQPPGTLSHDSRGQGLASDPRVPLSHVVHVPKDHRDSQWPVTSYGSNSCFWALELIFLLVLSDSKPQLLSQGVPPLAAEWGHGTCWPPVWGRGPGAPAPEPCLHVPTWTLLTGLWGLCGSLCSDFLAELGFNEGEAEALHLSGSFLEILLVPNPSEVPAAPTPGSLGVRRDLKQVDKSP